MKQGWEYKKLGEVCEVVSGSTPKTNVPEYWGEGHYWVTPAELNDTIVYIDKTERQITDEALTKTKLRLLPVGTVLLSSRAPIGKVAITKTEMYCNQGFKNCICSDSIYNKYLFYFLRLKKEYLNSLGRGATFKEISKSIVESITIPLPPKSTQLSIVSELDKINELIRLKKEQLKDYDNLAQSIFYEMFGDPVENDKGWEVKYLNDICDVRDGTHDSPQYLQHSEYSLVTSKNIVNDEIDFSKVNYISEEDFNNINKRSKVDDGDIIMPMIGTIGNPIIVHIDKVHKFCIKNVALIKFVAETQISNLFLLNLMKCKSFNDYLKSHNKGGTQKFIALGTIRKLRIILPPLPLQHLFAQRIEQIERQRSAVQKSITDLETLLASRMQYWFE
ncbi:restriction endonuclease subunit S [uncultured Prevotella sp.]|uniref:restriction endonuclease subunit S n=1 Tax=uncultured Prevotella sp. TaxID=159272 RepID=UPI0026389A5F|nr:restriction endonuclease subunit S [uncultured Prevotella sp.]